MPEIEAKAEAIADEAYEKILEDMGTRVNGCMAIRWRKAERNPVKEVDFFRRNNIR